MRETAKIGLEVLNNTHSASRFPGYLKNLLVSSLDLSSSIPERMAEICSLGENNIPNL